MTPAGSPGTLVYQPTLWKTPEERRSPLQEAGSLKSCRFVPLLAMTTYVVLDA